MKKISTTKIFFDPAYLQNQSAESKKLERIALKAVIKKRLDKKLQTVKSSMVNSFKKALVFMIDTAIKIKAVSDSIDKKLDQNLGLMFMVMAVSVGLSYLYGFRFVLWLNGVINGI